MTTLCAYPKAKQRTENRDGAGAKSGRFRGIQQATTRITPAHFLGETPKEKGPETIRALVNGGDGRNRTADPGIMSAVL
jgi:hypothetical protein